MMKVTYKSNGLVLGNYWGGGKGSYKATTFHSDVSKEDLIEQNKKALESGALDSGMGYESLIGAILNIETISTTEIDNKPFTNTEFELIFIGELTEEEQQFLEDCLNNE